MDIQSAAIQFEVFQDITPPTLPISEIDGYQFSASEVVYMNHGICLAYRGKGNQC